MHVQNTGASNCIFGSSRSHFATSTSWSRCSHAISSPCAEPVRTTSPGYAALRASRTFCDIVILFLARLRDHLLALQAELRVAAAILDAIHQHDQRVEHLLGARRAAGDVDVDGDDLIGAGHRVIVLIEAAGRRA